MKIFRLTIFIGALVGVIIFFPIKIDGYCCLFDAVFQVTHMADSLSHDMANQYIFPFGLLWYASLSGLFLLIRKKRVIMVTIGFALFSSGYTQSLADLQVLAQENSTDILAARLKTQAVQYESDLISALPEPAVMAEVRGLPVDVSQYSQTREMMLMYEQMIPAADKRKHLTQKGGFARLVQAEQERLIRNSVHAQVSKHFFELGYMQRALESTEKYKNFVNSMIAIATAQFRINEKAKYEVYELKAQLGRVESQELALQQKFSVERAALNRLLNRPLDQEITFLPDSTFNISVHDSLGIEDNPLVCVARFLMQSAENDIEFAQADNRPDLKIMGGYMFMNGMDDALMARVGVTLPWLSRANKTRIEKNIVLHQHQSFAYRAVQEKMQQQLYDWHTELTFFENRIQLHRATIIPALENALELAKSEYINNNLPAERIIEQADRLLENRLELDHLKSLYKKRVADIENIIGLPNRGVKE